MACDIELLAVLQSNPYAKLPYFQRSGTSKYSQSGYVPSQENLLADLLSRRDFKKLANSFPLLTQPMTVTRRHPGTTTSTYPASPPATSGGASAPILDVHMERHDGAILPAAQ